MQDRSRAFLLCFAELQGHPTGGTVHDVRVAARRLSAVIDVVQQVAGVDTLGRVQRRLQRALKKLNSVRDIQIQREIIDGLKDSFPLLEPLSRDLQRRQRVLIRRAVQRTGRLDVASLERTLSTVGEILRDLERTLSCRTAMQTVLEASRAQAYLRVIHCRRLLDRHDLTSFHHLRVSFKKYRYITEIMTTGTTESHGTLLQQMADFQDTLGAVQDWIVSAQAIRTYVKRPRFKGDPSAPALMRFLDRRKSELLDAVIQALPFLDDAWEMHAGRRPTLRMT